jgi:hypothetical protein
MISLLESVTLAMVFTFVPVFGLIALNDTAAELELPFGDDPNDLPLESFQEHMNNALLMLIRQETDHVPFVVEARLDNTNFDSVKRNINNFPPRHFVGEEVQKRYQGEIESMESARNAVEAHNSFERINSLLPTKSNKKSNTSRSGGRSSQKASNGRPTSTLSSTSSLASTDREDMTANSLDSHGYSSGGSMNMDMMKNSNSSGDGDAREGCLIDFNRDVVEM